MKYNKDSKWVGCYTEEPLTSEDVKEYYLSDAEDEEMRELWDELVMSDILNWFTFTSAEFERKKQALERWLDGVGLTVWDEEDEEVN